MPSSDCVPFRKIWPIWVPERIADVQGKLPSFSVIPPGDI